MGSTNQHNIAAIAAIAAARAALRDILLPPEGFAAITSISSFYVDSGPINKHPDGLKNMGMFKNVPAL